MAIQTIRLWLGLDGERIHGYTDVDIVGVKPDSVIVSVEMNDFQVHIDQGFVNSFWRSNALVIDTTEQDSIDNTNSWTTELFNINKWFIDNQDIVTQQYLGEILHTDQVYIDYIAERAIKKARKAELEGYLGI